MFPSSVPTVWQVLVTSGYVNSINDSFSGVGDMSQMAGHLPVYEGLGVVAHTCNRLSSLGRGRQCHLGYSAPAGGHMGPCLIKETEPRSS